MMSERIYTYRFRLYPNVEQRVYLAQVFGCCRKVYNHFLDIKTKQYEQTKTSDSYAVQQSELTKLRKEEEFSYMSVVPLQSLQCSLQNLHNAFKRFYKGLGGYPNFKKKRDGQSFRIAQPNTMHISDGKLYIPKLKSGIEVVVSKPIIGHICFATVTKSKSGKYFVTITVRQNEYERFERTGKSVGIDLGIKDLVITSDGVKYGRKKQQIKNEKRKLKHNQRLV